MIALLAGVSGAWAQVSAITSGDLYTIRLNKANTYFFGYHYKTTSNPAPFKLIDSGQADAGYALYYIQCPFSDLYLHSTRTLKDGSSISLEWVANQADATLYSFRPTTSGGQQFRIYPQESSYSLTAWNSNNPNYNIVPWDDTSDLGVWNLISANDLNEYEIEVTELNGVFSRTGGGTSNWKDKWDAAASLFSLQITTPTTGSSYRYDMMYSSPTLTIASSSDKTAYYTMTAPLGCVISGYRINGTTNGTITVVKGDGTSIAYESGATLTDVGESGFLRKSTKFTLQGENKTIAGSLHIKVKRLKTISSINEIDRNKCYAIDTEERGNWSVRNGYQYLTRNGAPGLNITSDFSDLKQQFAFVMHENAYYLYSVGAQKFITASATGDNSVITLDTRASQSVTLLSSDVSNYPVCVEMSNTADLNVRNDDWEAGVVVYGTNGSHKDDPGNAVRVYEIADFDPTAAEDTWNVLDISYSLYYNGNQIGEPVVVENVTAGTPAVIPSSMDNGFMTYTYTPAIISSNSNTVRIDAIWNGPFQLSPAPSDGVFSPDTKWYTIGHNKSEEANNYIWKYIDSNGQVMPEMVATDNYAGVTNNHLFCFVGNPYSGLTIYNKGAGSSLSVYSPNSGTQVTMNATGTQFIPSSTRDYSIANGYFSLKPVGSSYYLNWNKVKLGGYSEADNGGTCWVTPEGKYYFNYLNSLPLDAPVGAVGTSEGISDESVRTELIQTKAALTENLFYLDTKTQVEKIQFKTMLNGVRNSSTIVLGEGYFRIVNAFTKFTTKPAWYYNSSAESGTGRIRWSTSALTDASHQVNTIFKLTSTGNDNEYYILSPNAQKSFKAATEDGDSKNLGYLDTTPGAISFTALTPVTQFNLKVSGNTRALHAADHNEGAGTEGRIVSWNSGANSCSAWYIVKVDNIELSLNDGGDGNYYATLCLPFDVTLSEACAYTLTLNGTKTALTLSSAMNEVPAGTPVFLKATTGSVTASIAASAATGAPLTSTALSGTYVDKSVTGGDDYFLGKADNKVGFYHWDGSMLKANRAYLEASKLGNTDGNVKGFAIDFDSVDAIKSLFNEEGNAEIYNLAGQRLNKLQKGVNIVNGKKVLVK